MNYLHQHKPHPIIHRDLTPRYCFLNLLVLLTRLFWRSYHKNFLAELMNNALAPIYSILTPFIYVNTPRNVLQDESGHLKVTDFGLSKIAQEKDAGYKMTGGTGSCKDLLSYGSNYPSCKG